jgi:hypothetical protein
MSKQTLLIFLGATVVFAGVAMIAKRSMDGPASHDLAECAQRLFVIAHDGLEIPAVIYRCDELPGRHPALVVWPSEPGSTAGWVAGLDTWAREGRHLMVLGVMRRPGMERIDLSAAVEALADEPHVDPARLAFVAEGHTGLGLLDEGRFAWPEPAAAGVLSDPPAELGPLVVEAGDERLAMIIASDSENAPDAWSRLERRSFPMGRPSLAGAPAEATRLLLERFGTRGGE